MIRILTSVFPRYFAIITRVREEVKSMGPDGGKVERIKYFSLADKKIFEVVLPEEPRLRATFPKNALYKKIKVGLQVQAIRPELVTAAFGRSVEVGGVIVTRDT